MMFRDEADIIQESIQHWIKIGVNTFFLCNNGSKDDSGLWVYYEMKDAGYSETIHDESTDWPGRRIINELKQRAINYGCDWLFPADADEFLQLPEGFTTVQDWLNEYPDIYGWGELPYLNILPDGREYWQEPHRKAFGKLKREWMVSMGNHLIEGVKPIMEPMGAYYRHYSIRSPEQFRKKMINWMTAFSQMPYPDHPHYQNWLQWQAEGDGFIERLYKELTENETNI